MQWLGDVSYSVYLWHFPLIVLLPFVTGHQLHALDDIAVIAATLVLAGLTKPLIEDPLRRPSWGTPLYKPYLLAAAGMVVVVSAAQLQGVEVHHRQVQAAAAAKEATSHALATHAPCFGAAALSAPPGACPTDNAGPLTPPPIDAPADKSDAYEQHGSGNCFAAQPDLHLRDLSLRRPDLTDQGRPGRQLPRRPVAAGPGRGGGEAALADHDLSRVPVCVRPGPADLRQQGRDPRLLEMG